MITKRSHNEMRKMRHARIREKVSGTSEKPRLSVFRSAKHIYAQLVDDSKGETLVAVSSRAKNLQDQFKGKSPQEVAEMIGSMVAELALAKNINKAVFDRGGYKFHGRVAALAQGATQNGIKL